MNYFVYILTNSNNSVIYTGVTNNLSRRLFEHKSGTIKGFTKKYHVDKLVYCERYNDIMTAIKKQIKGWTRIKKNNLIESVNPKWTELTDIY